MRMLLHHSAGVRYAVPCFFVSAVLWFFFQLQDCAFLMLLLLLQTTCPVPEAAYEQMAQGKPQTDDEIADDWLHLLLAHRKESPMESVGRGKLQFIYVIFSMVPS